jgi:SAM-dependent methyltransferase
MTAISSGLDPGKAPHGVRQIVRFNWPFYAVGIPAAIAAPLIIARLSLGPVGSAVLHGATVLAWYWIAASLIASWLIYDRSPLMSGTWILRALGDRPGVWITIHAGFDGTSDGLSRVFGSSGRAFDIYDAAEMTESSIARARRAAGSRAESADYRHLPVPSDSLDAAMVLLSAHELRSDGGRTALFREVNRTLAPHGRIVVAEHLRDLPNFLAFGPGFLHFFPRRAWFRCFERAPLTLIDEFSITPFVRVFVLAGEPLRAAGTPLA